jgi:hypothetical protein
LLKKHQKEESLQHPQRSQPCEDPGDFKEIKFPDLQWSLGLQVGTCTMVLH